MPNRVIKESIWTSPNLNRLSDLAERHFYRILCLPDDFGCCEVTPLVVKGRCYPLKENITTTEIMMWNKELEISDIIRIWSEGERFYAYFPTFGNHQRVRSKHLRKTPEPPESVICRQPPSNDDACHLNPNPNPNPNALSKDKAVASPPVFPSKLQYPGSKHYSNKLLTATVEEIDKACRDIKDISRDSPKGNGFNPYSFVQEAVNKTQHPSAILEALAGLIKIWPTIDIPYRWGWSIIKTKSGNYNESDHRKQTEEFKKEWNKFAKEAFG